MADNHCFVGRREVGKTRLMTSSGNRNSQKSPQKLSDILRMRRLRLGRGRTTLTNSISDSLSEPRHASSASRTSSNSMGSSAPSLMRQSSTHSYQSARSFQSTKSNATALTSLSGSERHSSRKSRGHLRRYSKYEEDVSDGQLGLNEKELVSMNKHIPALKSHGKSATFRQHYYPEGGWGWVITFCCFIANLFTTGLQLTFGVLLLQIQRHCGGETSDMMSIVWIGSTNFFVSRIMAPFLVALCRRKSTRLTAVVGGLVMSLALLFASFAKEYHQILLSYGFLLGLGCSMVRESSSLMLSQYFKRRRELVETISACGNGIGIIIFSAIFQTGFNYLGWRFGLQAVSVAVTSLFFVGLFYRSASLYHPQRRAILHLKDMSKRKGKDKAKIESKPPYFDFSLMGARHFQVLLFCVTLGCLGAYTPCFYFVVIAQKEGLQDKILLLQTFFGFANVIGTLCFGSIIKSRSQDCLISRQYLLQASLFGIGVSMIALTSVEGYHGYLLFVWMYGIALAGFELSLKIYTYERVRIRHFTRGWGFVQGAKALPVLVGIPITGYINESSHSNKSGMHFSVAMVVTSCLLLYLMKFFRHRHLPLSISHNDLCKVDTVLTPSEANDQGHMHNGNGHSIMSNNSQPNGQVKSPDDADCIANEVQPEELVHLECTCEKGVRLSWPEPINGQELRDDVVAVLEEEDVVLDDYEEVVKEEDDDIIEPIFEEDEDEEDAAFQKSVAHVSRMEIDDADDDDDVLVPVIDVQLHYDITDDIISEGDEENGDYEDVHSNGIVWSEAVAVLEFDSSDRDRDPAITTVRLKSGPDRVPTRSHSESDLTRALESGRYLKNFGRLPASARQIDKPGRKKATSKSQDPNHRVKILGSVGQLLAQFQSRKSWHKFKPVRQNHDSECGSQSQFNHDVTTLV